MAPIANAVRVKLLASEARIPLRYSAAAARPLVVTADCVDKVLKGCVTHYIHIY